MKILIIRFSSIGDILLTFHVIKQIEVNYPNAEIHFLTKSEHAALLKSCETNLKVHILGPSLFQTSKSLLKEKFDTVIDLHNNVRTLILQMLMLRFEWHRFNKLNFKKFLLTQFKIDLLPEKHVVDRYFDACHHLKLINKAKAGLRCHKHIDVKDLNLTENGYVAWVLGAKFKTKQVPFDKIIEIMQNIKRPILLLGGKEELELSKKIFERFPSVVNVVGRFSLNESAFLLGQAKVVLSNDTGLMHMAAFYDKPLICIWGNTTKKFGMFPYNTTNVEHFEVHDLKCRPCSKIGYSACPKSHFLCMMSQDALAISNAINEKFRA